MNIRTSNMADLDRILQIYEYAREQMRQNGNPNQWKNNRPSKETVIWDIEHNHSYVIEANGRICGVFSFIIGEEPTYKTILEGNWKNTNTYGTIHRIASDGSVKGILKECLKYCESKISNIKIDTHQDNLIMQHLLEKNGFERCGIIFVEDGTTRIAYQKVL